MFHPVITSVSIFAFLLILLIARNQWRHRYERAGLRFLARKDYGNAVISFEKSLEVLGPSLAGFTNLSSALVNAERSDEAIQVLDRAVELGLVKSVDEMDDISLAEAVYLNNRGIALLDVRRYAESLDCLEKALRHTDPKSVAYRAILINYRRAYASQYERDAASEVLKRINQWFEIHDVPFNQRPEIEQKLKKLRTDIGFIPEGNQSR